MNKMILQYLPVPVFGLALLLGLAFSSAVQAESRWVSDEFEVMLRTGPSTNNAIELMVDSGTELEILDEDADAGYTRVRTRGGTEGWVLTRYLMSQPSARERLLILNQQLTDATSDSSDLGSQLSVLRGEHEQATRQVRELEQEKATLQSDLDEISQKAANTLAIDRQNQDLRQQLTDAEIKVDLLEQENEDLSGQSTRYWFAVGAAVLFVGVLVGLILPRMKIQRRSGYDSF